MWRSPRRIFPNGDKDGVAKIQLDLNTGFRICNKTQYGGYGEAVNTYDCDSYIRGFKSL